LSYAHVERKKEIRGKVDGGSSIDVVSGGFDSGNIAKIIINNEQVFTTTNIVSKANMKGATMSSNYLKGDLNKAAALALDTDGNTHFHTKCGKNEWWSAHFDSRYLITEVKIRNSHHKDESSLRRLQKAEVTIEGQFCGNLPENTPGTAEWYTVKCERPVAGTNIMVRNTLNKCLHFTSIEVTGSRMDTNGGRGINVVALNQRDHSILLAKSYDTFANENASQDMINDLKGVRRGSVIVAAVRDEGSKKLSTEVKAMFGKWGSKEIHSLGHREGWAFIGVKG